MTTYTKNDFYMVRTGEIVVEYAPVVDGTVDSEHLEFCRFRSYMRALHFAQKQREMGYSVKAWKCDSSDQSHTLGI